MHQRSLSQIVLRGVGFGLGLINILGGIAAFGRAQEPERYFVSTIVMICSGVLWLISSLFRRFNLTRKQYIILLTVLPLGLLLGLSNTFFGCGGECGGTGFCHWYLGYPGRWLRISNCMVGSEGTVWWQWMLRGSWRVDLPSFVADLVFWSGAGLILAFLLKRTHLKSTAVIVQS